MGKKYYKKSKRVERKTMLRALSLSLILIGGSMIVYIFLPLLSWKIYFEPVFASQNISSPIPRNSLVSNLDVKSLIAEAANQLSGVDYTNAKNWFPTYQYQKKTNISTDTYKISIPKIKIKNAIVSTIDTDLGSHLVNFGGTAIPFEKGNAVVFGHSTLPQLYDPKSYTTIFTYLYELSPGDEITVSVGKKTYKYRVENVTVIDPDNTTVLEQNYSDSFLTLVTCTPPGTIWKRLVVKSRIVRT